MSQYRYPDDRGHFGAFGGRYVAETLMPALLELEEAYAQIKDDPEIGVLVLGAGIEKGGPGPLVTHMTRQAGNLPIPVTIVPGSMSKERLEDIT